ncbi:MAG: polyphosphate kinase 2 family protein [Anaerolineae bacterium]
MDLKKRIQPLLVPPGKEISLQKDYAPDFLPDDIKANKQNADELLTEGIQTLAEYQDKLYAQNIYALLVILQAMDAAGKDGAVKHVMSGLNPQGVQVYSFKQPSPEELDHDFLWRSMKALPERGRIGIFNRSYYEEVLVVRVHPEILARQQLPPKTVEDRIWKRRYEDINNFEKYLVGNGIEVVKIFLNVSKDEQKKRFLERIDRPEKNWKFSSADVRERAHWDDYQDAYEKMFNHTSTEWAPWYIVPADRKWFARLAVAAIIGAKLQEINPQYPTISEEQRQELLKAKALLESEE